MEVGDEAQHAGMIFHISHVELMMEVGDEAQHARMIFHISHVELMMEWVMMPNMRA